MSETKINRSCCKIDKVTWIIGIIKCVILGAASLIALGLLMYALIILTDRSRRGPVLPRQSFTDNMLFILLFQSTVVLVPCLVTFVFSVLLVYGISKKKPALVLTYFIFMIILILATAGGSLGCFIEGDSSDLTLIFGWLTLVFCIIFVPVLIIVWMTYRKLKADTIYQPCGHRELFETNAPIISEDYRKDQL